MKTKKLTKTLCCAFMAVACFLCGAAMLNVSADEAITANTFEVNATSIRYADDGSDGIRFRTSISKAEFDAMKQKDENLTAGLLYLPTELLDGDLTIDKAADSVDASVRAGEIKVVTSEEDSNRIKEVTDEEGNVTNYEFYTYVYDIPQECYNKPITAVGYICCGGQYYYSGALSRSIAHAAQMAYEAEKNEAALVYIPGEDVNYTVNVYLQNKDGSYNETPTETETLSGKINETVIVDTKTGYEPMVEKKEEISETETIYYANDGLIWADGSTVINQYYAKEIIAVNCKDTYTDSNGNKKNVVRNSKASVNYLDNGAQAYVELGSHTNEQGDVNSAGEATCQKDNYVNYIGLSDTYNEGENYIRFEFKGANPIGEVIFGVQDEFSHNLSTVKGSGLDLNLSSGGIRVRMFADPNNVVDGKAAPFEIDKDDVKGSKSTSIKDSDNNNTLASSNVSHNYFKNNKDKDFVMIVGTSVSPANKARYRLYVYLYEKDGNELTLLTKVETSNVTNMHYYPNGKIMVVSECNYGNDSKFTMWRPTTLEKAMEQLNKDYTVNYTVKFMNGEKVVSTQTVKSGEKATAPNDPTPAENTVFSGWFDNWEKQFDPESVITYKSCYEYYAKFTATTTSEDTTGTTE